MEDVGDVEEDPARLEQFKSQWDRESSPSDKAAAMGRGSSPTGKAAVIFDERKEGKTPRMGSAAEIVSPRRDGILEGEMGPYNPSSSVTSASKSCLLYTSPSPRD